MNHRHFFVGFVTYFVGGALCSENLDWVLYIGGTVAVFAIGIIEGEGLDG